MHQALSLRRRPAVALALVAAGSNLRPAITSLSPLMPELRRSYHIPAQSTVLVVALPVLLLGIGSSAGPALARRLGSPERAVAGGLFAIAAGIALRCAWSPLILPGTVLAALGITVVAVLLPAIVRGHGLAGGPATAAYGAAMSVGAAAAPALSGLLVDAGVPTRASTGVWALLALAAAVVWLALPASDAVPTESGAGRVPRAEVAALAGLFALQALLFFAIVAWLPDYVRAHGTDAAGAGLVLALFSGVGVGAAALVPLAAAHPRTRPLLVVTMALGAAAGFALLAAGASPVLAALVLGLSQASFFPLTVSLFVLRAPEHRTAATLSAVSQGIGFTAAACCLVGLAGVRLLADWPAFWAVLSVLAAAQLPIGLRAAAPHHLSTEGARPAPEPTVTSVQ
ncbi:MAG: MFS transporter [Nocardioidaceae bacterium]|nr:MFS transporter [Nocardioidaceae bacterium]